MQVYRSNSGKESGVTAFEVGEDSIMVEFQRRERYLYTYRSAGKTVIEKMIALAKASEGLSTFISRNNPAYESKSVGLFKDPANDA